MGSKIINCIRQAEEEADYKMESFLYPVPLIPNQCMGVGFYFYGTYVLGTGVCVRSHEWRLLTLAMGVFSAGLS